METMTTTKECCEHLLRAERFIKNLIQHHFAQVADQCADIVQKGHAEPHLRQALARVLGTLQVMRDLGAQYKRQVQTQADALQGMPALRACMGHWLTDLDDLIECHAVGSPTATISSLTASLGKDQAEQTYLMDSNLVRLYTEMRSTSTAWLAQQS